MVLNTRIATALSALPLIMVALLSAPVSAQNKDAGSPTSAGTPTSAGAPAAAGQVLQIKKSLTGEFTYRFFSASGYSTAPAALPAAAPGVAAPISVPAEAAKATLEVVDKTRGNVAQIPVSGIKGGAVALDEASFKAVQTVFVTVQKAGKPVTDVLVTMSTPDHKFSMAFPLKASDAGVAQFPTVPMGVPITVAVNAAGHPPFQSINTLQPGHPAEGVHWPVIQVDWADVATLAPPPTAPVAAAPTAPAAAAAQKPAPETGGGFSQILNLIIALGFLAALAYGVLWAFNNGHVKTLLEKAGVNTSELKPADGAQPSPFDKPAAPPITPITEGTADPFGGAPFAGAPAAAYAAAPSGPRLVATAGSYSGTIFAVTGTPVTIGRDTAAGVSLSSDTSTSRQHALLSNDGGQYSIADAGSSNGTFLNGVRLQQGVAHPLRSGDEIQIGQTRFRFEA